MSDLAIAAIDTGLLRFVFLGIGLLIFAAGIYSIVSHKDPVADRMRAAADGYAETSYIRALTKSPDQIPEGILKALIPEDRTERTMIQSRLRQAGFDGPNAVRNFFLLRLSLAVAGPVVALIAYSIQETIGLPSWAKEFLIGLSSFQVMQGIALCTAVGFYGPTYWLKRKIQARKTEIEDGFPNALDLLQISTEAGLGFDAAMVRVAESLAPICPSISEEFMTCQSEILAGRDRDRAMSEMADRMGVEEVQSFVGLISQSMEYGVSISQALKTYADEMREAREMRAQEKANKLPVQMSGVMATLMLPALFLITLGPTIIRYLQL